MSDEVVSLEVLIESAKGAETLKELKKSIRDLTDEAIKAEKAGNSILSEKLFKAAAQAKDDFNDINEKLNQLNPDERAGQWAKLGHTMANAFSGAVGAMSLLGFEGDNVAATLLKIQSLSAIAEGFQSLNDAQKLFGNISMSLSTMTDKVGSFALKAGDWLGSLWKTIKANPVEALSIAVGVAATGFALLAEKIFGAEDHAKKLMETIAAEKKQIESLNPVLDAQIRLLEAQGGNEENVYNIKKKRLEMQLILLKQERLANELKLYEIQTNDDLLESQLRLAAIAARKLGMFEEEKMLNEQLQKLKVVRAKDEIENEQKLNNQITALTLDLETLKIQSEKKITDNHKQNSDTRIANNDHEVQELKRKLLELGTFQNDFNKMLEFNEQNHLQTLLDQREEYINKTGDLLIKSQEDERNDAAIKKKFAEDLVQARLALLSTQLDAVASGINILAGFVTKNKRLQEAMFLVERGAAAAKVFVDGMRERAAIFAKYSLVPGGQVIAAAEATASRIRTGISIASILATTIGKFISGSGSGGSGGGGPSLGFTGGINAAFANGVPIQPVVPNTNSTILDPNTGQPLNQNQGPIKAYVVETEMTSSQRRINSIENKARF